MDVDEEITPKNNQLKVNEADNIINNLLNDGDLIKKKNSPEKIFKIDKHQVYKKETHQQQTNQEQ